MDTLSLPLDALHADPANARTHGDRNLEAIRASLATFGQVEPLVVHKPTRRVIGGNGRLSAMKALGWTHADVVELDISDTQATALGIALNRTAELAEWDLPSLGKLLESLPSLEGAGFNPDELKDLLASLQTPGMVEDPGPAEPPEVATARLGDVWHLGDHRLMCGDSTSGADFVRLMQGERAALLSTDPPYCVSYTGNDRPVHDGKPSGKDWTHVYREIDIADLGEFLDGMFAAVLPGGVRLDTGAWSPQDVDLALPANVPWVIGRSYNPLQETSGSSHLDSAGPQGLCWFQSSQPEIVLHDDVDNTKDTLYLVFGADRYLEFVRAGSSSSQYKGKNGAAGVFDFQAGATSQPDLWVWTDQVGNKTTFFGFDVDAGVAAGQIWSIADPSWDGSSGNIAYVGDKSSATTAISNGFDGSGRILKAFDSADRRFTYTYTSIDGTSRLTQVKAEIKSGGTWASPSGVEEVGKVDYAYYTTAGGESWGESGDLKLVTLTVRLNDETTPITQTKKKHYRYWEGTYNASTNPGVTHQVRMVVDFEGTRRHDWQDATFDEDFLTETVDNLKPYAAVYLEYASDRKVAKAWMEGDCGCGGGSADGAYEFTYGANADYSDSSGYQQLWARRAVVEKPDGSFLTQYFDEVGQPLSQVITDADPATGSPDTWVTQVERTSAGLVSLVRTPANNGAYYHVDVGGGTPKDAGTIEPESGDDAGLVWTFDRESSGNLTGFQTARRWSEGASGTKSYESSQTWTNLSRTITDATVVRPLLSASRAFPTEQTTQTGYEQTSYTYTAYGSDAFLVEKLVVEHPIVATGNNGEGGGTGNKEYRHYLKSGEVDFVRRDVNATDYLLTYYEYANGQVTEEIQDADTGDGDITTEPSDSTFHTQGGVTVQHKKTTTTYTAFGAKQLLTPPGGEDVSSTYRTRLADQRLVTIEYNDHGSGTFYGPASYAVTNQAGQVEFQGLIGYSGNTTSTTQPGHIDESDSDPITAVDAGSVVRMTTRIYDETGHELEEERTYFAIPTSGAGTDGTHYDAVTYAYDAAGRRIRTKEPHGTIRRTTYDLFGRATEQWIGTNDQGLPSGESSGTNNMVKTEASTFDLGNDGGNGLLTSRTLYVEDSTTGQRVTNFVHDLRGRVIVEKPPVAPYTVRKVDNRGRVVAVGNYSSDSGLTASTDPTSTATNRLALQQTVYDERGRDWKNVRHKIDPADGSDDDTLESTRWYDRLGRQVKEDGETLSKTIYDRLGRVTDQYVLAQDNDSAYADALTVSGDTVLEETQTRYDEDHGTVLFTVRIERLHDDLGSSRTLGSLDTNADSDSLQLTMSTTAGSSNVKGRPTITAYWYDRMKRETERVEYGTYALATWTQPGSAPSSADTTPRWSTGYAIDGSVLTVTNPLGKITRTEVDAAGRVTREIRNYEDGTPSGTDSDVTLRYEYVDGLRTKYIADLPSGQTDQETVYIRGTTKGTPAAMKISTGHGLRATKFPDSTNAGTTSAAIDSDSSDVVSHAYDAQEATTYTKDQAGNVIEVDFDLRGRPTARNVTTLAGGFDGAVRRIATSYDSLGRVELVTQYDAATSGSVTDEVKSTYDGWGNLTKYEQDRDSAVGASGSVNDYEISYAFEKATTGRNTLRRTTMTMPSGAVTEYKYRTRDDLLDSVASRVTDLMRGATPLAVYDYVGVGRVVGQAYPEPDVMWKQQALSGWNDFPDLDRFGRVIRSRWTKDLATDVDFYRVDYSWDRNGNVTSAEDHVHAGFDVKYTMDNVDRLVDADEGTLSGGSITSRTRRQQWTLNQTGNWDNDKVDLNGDGDWGDTDEVNDSRTHNAVNELTGRNTDSSGGDEYTLAYDAVGNLTDDGEDYEYEWDAFGRLRKVKRTDNQALVAEYRYNGLNHRIAVHEDTDLDGDVDANDKWYYDAFDEQWRQVARFRESDTSPKEEFVPHAAGDRGFGGSSYIDLVVCRDKDANTAWTSASDGTLEERVYYCQNWRADVSAIVSAAGGMLEWAKYSAYGVPFGLPGGDADSDGDCDAADATQIQAWIDAPVFDGRGDLDLDGVVDAADKLLAVSAPFHNASGARSVLSSVVDNTRACTGVKAARYHQGCKDVRRRVLNAELGRWASRDPIEYADGPSSYEANKSNPPLYRDPNGLSAEPYSGRGWCEAGVDIQNRPTFCRVSSTVRLFRVAPVSAPHEHYVLGTCPDNPHCNITYTTRLTIEVLVAGTWQRVGGQDDPNAAENCHFFHGASDCKTSGQPGWSSGHTGTEIPCCVNSTNVDCGEQRNWDGPTVTAGNCALKFLYRPYCTRCRAFPFTGGPV